MGIERLMKLVIILDYMADVLEVRHGGLKRYVHDLLSR